MILYIFEKPNGWSTATWKKKYLHFLFGPVGNIYLITKERFWFCDLVLKFEKFGLVDAKILNVIGFLGLYSNTIFVNVIVWTWKYLFSKSV